MCLIRLKDYNINFNKVKLYIYRNKHTGCGLSRPCLACLHMIKLFNISNIYYTTENGYTYEQL